MKDKEELLDALAGIKLGSTFPNVSFQSQPGQLYLSSSDIFWEQQTLFMSSKRENNENDALNSVSSETSQKELVYRFPIETLESDVSLVGSSGSVPLN